MHPARRYVQHRRLRNLGRHVRRLRYPVHTMTNYFASSLLDAMGKVLRLHAGTCQFLDRETGELMWLVDASDEKHWWKVARPNLYEAVYELGVLVGVEWED